MLLKPSQRRTLDGDGASPPPTMKVDVHPPHGVMSPMGKRPHMVGLKKPNMEFDILKKKKLLVLPVGSPPFPLSYPSSAL